MNIANMITISRLVILPFFIFFFYSGVKNNLMISGIIFTISGLTDLLDGYIARKYNQVSKLGRLLDPLADKLTIISTFILLATRELIPLSVILVILIREIIILLGSFYVYINKSDIISPSKFGKSATFSLYVTAVAYILNFNFFKNIIFIAIPLTIISGLDYLFQAYNSIIKNG